MCSSAKDRKSLPSIEDVESISRGFALLDAILMPEWEHRYFSYDQFWNPKENHRLASWRDGSGDEYFILITNVGVVGKVYCHDLPPEPPENVSQIPKIFDAFKNEPAFSLEFVTYFFWRDQSSHDWHVAPRHCTEFPLLEYIIGGFESYFRWAIEYYERSLDSELMHRVFTSLDITSDELEVLNPEIEFHELQSEMLKTGIMR